MQAWKTSTRRKMVGEAINRKGRLIESPEFLSCVASALSSPADLARIKIRSTHPRDNQKVGVLRETIVTSKAVSPIEQLARERKGGPRYSMVDHKLFEQAAISRSASSDGRGLSVRNSPPRTVNLVSSLTCLASWPGILKSMQYQITEIHTVISISRYFVHSLIIAASGL